MINLSPEVTPDGDFTRADFIAEFAYRYQPGQHVVFFAPTGRGKTTLAGQMLAAPGMPKNDGLVITSLGADKALSHLGKRVASWPPPSLILDALVLDHKDRGVPLIRRYEPLPKRVEDFAKIRNQNRRILRWLFGRFNWTLFLPDLQILTDPQMQGLGKDVDQIIITARKRKSSIWMDAQAPRWVPRSAADNTQHLLIWRNRDEDSVRRIARIIGIDYRYLLAMFRSLDYHDALWVDVTADEFFIVRKN